MPTQERSIYPPSLPLPNNQFLIHINISPPDSMCSNPLPVCIFNAFQRRRYCMRYSLLALSINQLQSHTARKNALWPKSSTSTKMPIYSDPSCPHLTHISLNLFRRFTCLSDLSNWLFLSEIHANSAQSYYSFIRCSVNDIFHCRFQQFPINAFSLSLFSKIERSWLQSSNWQE